MAAFEIWGSVVVFSGGIEVSVLVTFGEDGAGGLDPIDVAVSGRVDGGDERGDDEPGKVCAMVEIIVGVMKAFVVCFRGVRNWLSVECADVDGLSLEES